MDAGWDQAKALSGNKPKVSSKDTDSCKYARMKILAGESTAICQAGSAETWLKSRSSWKEQRIQGSRETRYKARLSKGSDRTLPSISGGPMRRSTAGYCQIQIPTQCLTKTLISSLIKK